MKFLGRLSLFVAASMAVVAMAEDSATEDPATEDPATEDPTTEDPATEDLATEDPVAVDEEDGDNVFDGVEIPIMFDDCDPDEYYSSLGPNISTWDRESVNALLRATHRNVLNYTNLERPGLNDVRGALADVDVGSQPGTVRLIYSEQEIPTIPFGRRGWVREALWPNIRGPGILGPDVTDLHNLRPSTPLSDEVRGTKYFGECGVLVRPETCTSPAEGGAGDTCSCNRVYTPPASVRGDIARALMYMDLRYDGSEPFTVDLRLSDCPFMVTLDMAYLSQMLTWHEQDPPDEVEIMRNQKVCQNWQGVRNPFVDHPEFANELWGFSLPLPDVGERLIYEQCEAIPTLPPTTSANECDTFRPGDVMFWLVNSYSPDTVGLYTFKEMSPGFELFITDNPWDGEKFLETEGTMRFTAPDDGVPAGTAFGFGADDLGYPEDFDEYAPGFSLTRDGETIFVYCMASSGEEKPIMGFNYGGNLTAADLEYYEETETALPQNLGEDGFIDLPHQDNYVYLGGSQDDGLSDEELKDEVRNAANWDGSSVERFGVSSRSINSGALSTSQEQQRWASLVVTGIMAMVMLTRHA